MPNTWTNYECEFFTRNTANEMGDSKYLIVADKMTRTAFINLRRAPGQVCSENPAIAYLDENSKLYEAIMAERDDSMIEIVSVNGDDIVVYVRSPTAPVFGKCSRKPANGLITFDFRNNNGALSNIHVGHQVTRLTFGRPRSKSM